MCSSQRLEEVPETVSTDRGLTKLVEINEHRKFYLQSIIALVGTA